MQVRIYITMFNFNTDRERK